MHEEDSSLTQRIILKISKKGEVYETSPNDIEMIKKRRTDPIMQKFNDDATHIISQIEYGSAVFIELVHNGNDSKIFDIV